MNKEELKQKLESKKFNDTTIEFLTNAINDVEELYGEYISEETILERIKQNLNCDIEFMDDSENRTVGDIMKVNNKEVAILKGVTIRIKADSPLDDLEILSKELVEENERKLEKRFQERIKRCSQLYSNSKNNRANRN